MNLPPKHPLELQLAANWPPKDWEGMSALVAVSGGADSAALLRGLAAIVPDSPRRLLVGHLHHGLRGAAADEDAAFVAGLAERLGLPLLLGRADVTAEAARDGDGLEAAARKARYRFLQQTAQQVGARYVVTAHTADDQAETVLHHILRGTGLSGLGGMRRVRLLGPAVTLIRPMLELRRSDVLDYLAAIGQPYREDASNRERQFRRNRIRHELLPLLEREYGPAVAASLLRLARIAHEAEEAFAVLAEEWLDRCAACRGEVVELDCTPLAGLPRHLVREVLVRLWRRRRWPRKAMTFSHWDDLAAMVLAPPNAGPAAPPMQRVFPAAITVRREADRLMLRQRAEDRLAD